jgi:hypothetical protein
VRLVLTYQYGLRPSRWPYRRREAILEGQRLALQPKISKRAQPGLAQFATIRNAHRPLGLQVSRAPDTSGRRSPPNSGKDFETAALYCRHQPRLCINDGAWLLCSVWSCARASCAGRTWARAC